MLSLARKLSPSLNKRPPFPLAHFRYFYASPSPSTSTSSSSPSFLLHRSHHASFLPLFFPFCRPSSSAAQQLPPLSALRGGCYHEGDDDVDRPPPHLLPLCPGCGVHMQSSDPALPGFFTAPSAKSPDYRAPIDRARPLGSDDTSLSLFLKSGHLMPKEDPLGPDQPSRPLVCTRCHSLRHYGRVKNPSSENLLPDFDFDHMVGPKMVSPAGARSIVLMVVDAADFDGSFPRKVARLISSSIEKNSRAWKEGKPGNIPRAVLAVTKIDLLPSSISPNALEDWVRKRARVGGVSKLTAVHLVSAVRNWGVRNLVDRVRDLVGVRGNVWVVGAQNAGKSTLINSMARCVGDKVSHLTEAPVPGTTLGIIRMEGILNGKAKLFDTPGILHPYQITTRLTQEEQKLAHMSKELKPRTYRIKPQHSVHIGGLVRVDIEKSSVDSIYLTVWASPLVPLHMGKTENAAILIETHFGQQLQPPIGDKRVQELGKWLRKEFNVTGESWDRSSVDIAVAGLGWCAIALKGEALLGIWTYDGIDVLQRSSLIAERATIFEEAGFTHSKIVFKADSEANKLKHRKLEKKLTGSAAATGTLDEAIRM
ncbi:GTP-binding protein BRASSINAZOLE INSENSITIVE PALE GREEN 2, chloroplastic-like [Zingiber officinale]|uniref:GTP-binding protein BRASSINAZOLE INSENSITIVE PALE GREEN 2, chloroplastic-like n=1 Tax=Zingiber officinale TaxID=94328 RepID=UPI001C4B268E|nr:GTP-binding protein BRASSINAZOLE INSENSITIVE PALE GREEN 2, chloroplastic-like [Zingiber officinale]